MKYCPFCGKPAVDHAVFCRECGSRIPIINADAPSDGLQRQSCDEPSFAPFRSYKPFKYWLAWLTLFGVFVLLCAIAILL